MEPRLAWQPSLLDGGAPGVDVSFAALRRDRLDGAAWLDHAPGWLAGSDELFDLLLAEGGWQQREIHLYERRVAEPRLTAGWSLAGPAQVPAPLAAISAALSDRYGVWFDRIWCNLYRDGRDSVAWHGDRNARTQRDPLVATVSLGARRKFLVRRRGGGPAARTYLLGHGDLLVMGGSCQHDWQHAVPKTARPVGPRISVTLRHSAG